MGRRWLGREQRTHGIPRSTVDLDVIVPLQPARVRDLAAASLGEFEFDEEVLTSSSVTAAEPGLTDLLGPSLGETSGGF